VKSRIAKRLRNFAGHAGMHRVGLDAGGSVEWSGSAEPGVWIVAQSIPYEGITVAIPFATEVEALRRVNQDGYGAYAYFVPFGKDLREVMK
jgi:hypothetical protein